MKVFLFFCPWIYISWSCLRLVIKFHRLNLLRNSLSAVWFRAGQTTAAVVCYHKFEEHWNFSFPRKTCSKHMLNTLRDVVELLNKFQSYAVFQTKIKKECWVGSKCRESEILNQPGGSLASKSVRYRNFWNFQNIKKETSFKKEMHRLIKFIFFFVRLKFISISCMFPAVVMLLEILQVLVYFYWIAHFSNLCFQMKFFFVVTICVHSFVPLLFTATHLEYITY